jgi:hypothetical protein
MTHLRQARSKFNYGSDDKLRTNQREINCNAGGLRDAVPVPGLMPEQQPMVKKVKNRP